MVCAAFSGCTVEVWELGGGGLLVMWMSLGVGREVKTDGLDNAFMNVSGGFLFKAQLLSRLSPGT